MSAGVINSKEEEQTNQSNANKNNNQSNKIYPNTTVVLCPTVNQQK